jgi:hypothetical protein
VKHFIKVYEKKESITDRNTENTVHVFSDCVTSYDLKKLPEMLAPMIPEEQYAAIVNGGV